MCPNSVEDFMPQDDYTATMRLAVVTIEPPNEFHNDTAAVQVGVLRSISHLLLETIPSSIGTMYLWFASVEDRKEAMGHQPFMHEGGRIELHREEVFPYLFLIIGCDHLPKRAMRLAYERARVVPLPPPALPVPAQPVPVPAQPDLTADDEDV
ncbi:hypothetical protein D1007_58057 [Hordeum vulgare]|nr:hypothetical protein D1007_58057 [Hordeum vulgare]